MNDLNTHPNFAVNHSSRVDSIKDKIGAQAKKLFEEKMPEATPPPAESAAEPALPPPEATPATEAAPAADNAPAEPPAPEAPSETQAATPQGDKPAEQPGVTARAKLQRALELERKAEHQRRQAKEAAATAQRRLQEQRGRAQQLEMRERQIAEMQSKLQQAGNQLVEMQRLAQTNPAEFMRRSGMTGDQIAAFVRGDTNPLAAELRLLRAEMQRDTQALRQELSKSRAEQQQMAEQQRDAQAQRWLMSEVEKDGDRFEATSTIYSPDELVSKAESLAQESLRLNYGWDHDRFLDELETRAKQDPRYQRLVARYEPKKKPEASPAEPGAPAQAAQPEAAAPARREPKPKIQVQPQGSQIIPSVEPRRYSPMDAHRSRVNKRFGVG